MVKKEKKFETKLRRRRHRYVILLFFARYKIEGSNNKIVIASGRSIWNVGTREITFTILAILFFYFF